MSDTTQDAPERIWAKPPICWCGDRAKMSGSTEYVRADLVQAAVAAALVIAAYRIEAMRRDDYSHDAFDQHIADLKGESHE